MPYQVFMPVVEGEAPGRNTIPNPTGHANGTAMVVKDGVYVSSLTPPLEGSGSSGTIALWGEDNTLTESILIQSEALVTVDGTLFANTDVRSIGDIHAGGVLISDSDVLAQSGLIFGRTVQASSEGVVFLNDDEVNSVILKCNPSLDSSYALTLPLGLPVGEYQFLRSDPFGNLSFAAGNTGDVTGPAAPVVAGNIALWSGTSGTQIRDSGTTIPIVNATTPADPYFIMSISPSGTVYTIMGIGEILAQFMESPGSILYKNALGNVVSLPPGNPGEMLTMGTDGMPAWAPSQP